MRLQLHSHAQPTAASPAAEPHSRRTPCCLIYPRQRWLCKGSKPAAAWVNSCTPKRQHQFRKRHSTSRQTLRVAAVAEDQRTDSLANSRAGQNSGWEQVTERLVALTTAVFFVLLMPQIFKNFMNLRAGNAAAVSIMSWVVSRLSSHVLWTCFIATRFVGVRLPRFLQQLESAHASYSNGCVSQSL